MQPTGEYYVCVCVCGCHMTAGGLTNQWTALTLLMNMRIKWEELFCGLSHSLKNVPFTWIPMVFMLPLMLPKLRL